MKKYKAIIYDIDGTILDTLEMNIVPLMKIIEEETGKKVAYEELLKYAGAPGLKTMADLKIKNIEKTYARLNMLMNMNMVLNCMKDLRLFLKNLMEKLFKQLFLQRWLHNIKLM